MLTARFMAANVQDEGLSRPTPEKASSIRHQQSPITNESTIKDLKI